MNQITDILTVKAYVCQFKKKIALKPNSEKRVFLLKMIPESEVLTYIASGSPFRNIIDEWIYVCPQSPHIMQAFDVIEDNGKYMQLIEFEPMAISVYQLIKNLNLNFQSGNIPYAALKTLFQYIIQISHAFAIAHRSGLTHGSFNLSQVLITNRGIINESEPTWTPTFKITSFRPWLTRACKSKERTTLDQKVQISKCRDLFDFGKSIFEFLVGEK